MLQNTLVWALVKLDHYKNSAEVSTNEWVTPKENLLAEDHKTLKNVAEVEKQSVLKKI